MTVRTIAFGMLALLSLAASSLEGQNAFRNVATRIAGNSVLFDVSYDGLAARGASLQFTSVDPQTGVIRGRLTPARSTPHVIVGQLSPSRAGSAYFDISFSYETRSGIRPFVVNTTTYTGALRLNTDTGRTTFIAGTVVTTGGISAAASQPFSAIGGYTP